ncbi:MAG: class F sortase [Minisyncoccota bacterium]
MSSKLSLKQAVFVVGVMIMILFLVTTLSGNSKRIISGPPLNLKIPKIAVDTLIEQVGLTREGDVDSPDGPTNTAWYNLGPRPGEIGNSVIVGHFGWKNNTPAVFDNLSKLEKGDKIYVEDDQGIITTFIVNEIKTYDSKDNASDVFNSNDNKSHLNLITCKGVWNEKNKGYSERLVVFSTKE